MSLRPVVDAISQTPAVAQTISQLDDGHDVSVSVPAACAPYAIAALGTLNRPLLVLTASERNAQEITESFRDFLPPESVLLFPAWETLPHERLSPSSETIGQRIAVLHRLAHLSEYPATHVLVMSVRSFIQPIVQGIAHVEPIRVRVGTDLQIDALAHQLVEFGYDRVELIEQRGQFAVRGGIVDIFPPTDEHPSRIEFWGDQVEDIRAFSVADQRSIGQSSSELVATMCREMLLDTEIRSRAKSLIDQHPQVSDLLSKVADGIAVPGMEGLIPVLNVPTQPVTALLDESWIGVELEPERIHARVDEILTTSAEFLEAAWSNAAVGNSVPNSVSETAFMNYQDVKQRANAVPWCSLSSLRSPDELDVQMHAPTEYRSKVGEFINDLSDWRTQNAHIVLVMNGAGSAKRLSNTLAERNIPSTIVDVPTLQQPIIEITVGHQLRGVVVPEANLVVITEYEIFRNKESGQSPRSLPSRRRTTIDPLTLKSGDYVVHDQHGVGRYLEMISRNTQGAQREYLVIEYAPSKRGQRGDRVYVPTDQLDHVTRYIGGEAPTLNKLGGADWAATKSRARKAVRQIADELVRLYGLRMKSKGHAFASDTPWQRELEDAFDYVETPDQLSTINDVKADMERPIPMDRLVCGDVGYGKTEIAVRAAFKAVQDGKQVAIVVPTTLLVQQHYETFSRRYAQFPVRLAPLSRFQTDKEMKQTIDGMADGSIDIVIGTHRLFSPDVRFKDLGLVIVDEEQRFGVEHKEHLKALRTNVDMLTMSATPIPRTLEMAVTGIREMSTIQTPPEERLPVLTSVGPYDEKYIAAAIHRELLRDGQVYFVHNRVSSIYRVASRLMELVPDARIAVAHGQMNEHELEQVIVDFWEHNYDVLVSTTIIESGLDIPNANTLIVDRAETFGLAQLHQLRGRVGRSRERGYAYFLYQPEKPLSETAYDRLATIAAHTELGAGMAVAMKDLEIRGAGNLLGGEQSGHIAEVGFDLYVRLVNEAIAEVKNDEIESNQRTIKIELPVDAFIPHNFVPQERLRLEAYQRIAEARSMQAIDELVEELKDRYGELPEPVNRLLEIARLRVLLLQTEITDVVTAGMTVKIASVTLSESKELRLNRLYPGAKYSPAARTIVIPLPTEKRLGVRAQSGDQTEVIEWVTALVTQLFLD